MAATSYIPFLFLLFLLFLTSSLHIQARQPNIFFHKMKNFNVATEDRQLSIPKQKDPTTTASQNSHREELYGYYDPEKNPSKNTNYNEDAYEQLYDDGPVKGSPIGTSYNTNDFQFYEEQGTEKKPYTSSYYDSRRRSYGGYYSDIDENAFEYTNSMERSEGQPQDGFTP